MIKRRLKVGITSTKGGKNTQIDIDAHKFKEQSTVRGAAMTFQVVAIWVLTRFTICCFDGECVSNSLLFQSLSYVVI